MIWIVILASIALAAWIGFGMTPWRLCVAWGTYVWMRAAESWPLMWRETCWKHVDGLCKELNESRDRHDADVKLVAELNQQISVLTHIRDCAKEEEAAFQKQAGIAAARIKELCEKLDVQQAEIARLNNTVGCLRQSIKRFNDSIVAHY